MRSICETKRLENSHSKNGTGYQPEYGKSMSISHSITINLISICIISQYFKKDSYVFAHDPLNQCKVGDTVLVKELPEKLTRLITHSVEEVVFSFGDITDPISGKKVVVGQYRDDVSEANRTFGQSSNAFDYSKAPARGRLEGTRDFTHQETYIKWHDDGKDQPFAV